MKRWPWVRIVVSLVLGVLLTLASAWVLPNIYEHRTGADFRSRLYTVQFDEPRMVIIGESRSRWLTVIGGMQARQHDHIDPTAIRLSGENDIPDWVTADLIKSDATWVKGQETRVGWPLRCFRSTDHRHVVDWSAVHTEKGMHTLRAAGRVWTLHMLPMPLGLVLNLIVYSAVAGTVVFIPCIGRYCTRKRTGRCTACGYSLAGVAGPCPECGREPRRLKP